MVPEAGLRGAKRSRPAGVVGKERVRIYARIEPRIALPVGITRPPPGPHQHVRKTPLFLLPYTPIIRQGLSNSFGWVVTEVSRPHDPLSANHLFPGHPLMRSS